MDPRYVLASLLKYSKIEQEPYFSTTLTELDPISITTRLHGVTFQKTVLPIDTILLALRNCDCAKATFLAFPRVTPALCRCGNIAEGAVGFVGRVTTASTELYLFWCQDMTDL
jgi:hypothetical protein